MAIYSSKLQNNIRYVRADSMAQAVRLIRAIDGFCLRETISKIGDNFAASVGSALGYDTAASSLDNKNNRALKRQRIQERAHYAAGKGVKLPSGLVIHNY